MRFQKIKIFFKKLPRILAEKFFLTFLGLFFLSLIFNFIIFYKYSFLAKKFLPKETKKFIQFDEKNYQEVLKFWQEKSERFQKTNLKKYPNLF